MALRPYGIRVLKNGTEVFRQVNIPTSHAFTLENFEFTSNPEFTVATETTFSFELLGYCLIGLNGAPASAWDIEDVTITSNCSGGLNGGNLSISGTNGSTSMELCADDGIDDLVSVDLLNASGPNMAYVITDEDLNIIAIPDAQPFNFEGAGAGTCLIWNLSYIDGLQGATMGANAADLQGCYSLSNPITIIRNTGVNCPVPIIVIPGNLTATMSESSNGTFCTDDGIADMVDMTIEGNQGTGSAIVITNAEGMITALPNTSSYNFEGTSEGQSLIYHVAYNGVLANMTIGSNISLLEGNYALSVFIYDSYGKMIASYSIKTQAVNVNISQYAEGFYYIKMIAGDNESSRSFTKM